MISICIELAHIAALSFRPTTLIFACDWCNLPSSSTCSRSTVCLSVSFSVLAGVAWAGPPSSCDLERLPFLAEDDFSFRDVDEEDLLVSSPFFFFFWSVSPLCFCCLLRFSLPAAAASSSILSYLILSAPLLPSSLCLPDRARAPPLLPTKDVPSIISEITSFQ